MTFIINESVSNASNIAFDSSFTTHVSVSDGVWIEDGISEKFTLKLQKFE